MWECRSFKLGNTGDDLSLDAALVVSPSDLEESLISPALVPAVCDQPVRSAVLKLHPTILTAWPPREELVSEVEGA